MAKVGPEEVYTKREVERLIQEAKDEAERIAKEKAARIAREAAEANAAAEQAAREDAAP